ncbi:MAG: bifunctional glyoxylate/hydroxypyruvate reductase B [Desulfobulbaceae bacterium]|nr:MAG: bifunctional glyoxylate/hydroxypyruvate reductase B [Desulfobulbaceae bacterium]
MRFRVIQYESLPEDLEQRLHQNCEVTRVDSLSLMQGEEFRLVLAEAEGLIGVGQKVGPEILDLAPKLRVASTISVGYDYFDVDEMTRHKVMLMHTPDVLTETTADMIFTLILCAARRAAELHRMVKKGEWTSIVGPEHFGSDVYGKKLGIVGLGRIGSAVARRAYNGFNMEILYHNRKVSEEAKALFNGSYCSLDELLSESDFICLVLPLSDQTRKIIGPAEFDKMKPEAFLINGGRGPVIDEQALVQALQRGKIRGAGLDVYECEPLPLDSPLLNLPNVVTLPHIGSATHETRYAMAECAVDNLLGALQHRSTRNCVNPGVA